MTLCIAVRVNAGVSGTTVLNAFCKPITYRSDFPDVSRHFKPRRMFKIEIDDPETSVAVCQCVCLSRNFTQLRCARMAERTEVLFGVKTFWDPWNVHTMKVSVSSANSVQPLRNYFGHLL